MKKLTTADESKLESNYQSVKDVLLADADPERLAKPLGYWVLPNDRRLPLALLDRTLGDLLRTSFKDLSATPGIGQKKISSLIMLLQRATRNEPPSIPVGLQEYADQLTSLPDQPAAAAEFDPSMVSEALWANWQSVVRNFEIGKEKLGRLAPSLQNLPTVIWHTPLNEYLNHTVSEIRKLRTHGEKRVRCVLEVFHHVQNELASAKKGDNLYRLLTPPNILRVQDWTQAKLTSDDLPSEEEIQRELVGPLLDQVNIDSGETVYNLAAERLGMKGDPQSVRVQAKVLGVTRARVYQLLEDCGKVISIRWPEGRQRLELLTAKFAALESDNERLALFFGMRELFFPEKSSISRPTKSADTRSAEKNAVASESPVTNQNVSSSNAGQPSNGSTNQTRVDSPHAASPLGKDNVHEEQVKRPNVPITN
ncbi:MAG: hypothetical protein KDA87_10890 [Planctomycetales bacterium]|nr:hypothetical protein [Planctomycetales bacterium]